MKAVFNSPMAADGVSGERCCWLETGDIVGGLAVLG
jgi:hypothetical protein